MNSKVSKSRAVISYGLVSALCGIIWFSKWFHSNIQKPNDTSSVQSYFDQQLRYRQAKSFRVHKSCLGIFNLNGKWEGEFEVRCDGDFKTIPHGSFLISDARKFDSEDLLRKVNCDINIAAQGCDLHSVTWIKNFVILEKTLSPVEDYDTITTDNFYNIAKRSGTDKVSNHKYHRMYSKYLPQKKFKGNQFLEVGLGCNMDYGAGASAKIWKEYFQYMDIHFLEFDHECVEKWKDDTSMKDITVHTGDQADVSMWSILMKKLKDIEVFIDDGGHFNDQLIKTFAAVLPMMKPGSLMFIEDIGESAFLEGAYDNANVGGFDGTYLGYVKNIADRLTSLEPYAIQRTIEFIECQKNICHFKISDQ